MSTESLAGARDHARAQADATPPRGNTVPLGGYVARRLPRGTRLRLTDTDGDACVQLFVLNAVMPTERLNVMDTVKVQWQAYLGEGALLLSDMGRVLMTVVADTSQRHDCLCGATNAASAGARYGDGRASGPAPNGRDLLCLGAAKFGLGRADVATPVNLFKGARVEDGGALVFDGEIAPDRRIELRAEMDVIVVVAVTPHPLDPRTDYAGNAVEVTVHSGESSAADDPWRATSPERTRAFENTDAWLAGFAR